MYTTSLRSLERTGARHGAVALKSFKLHSCLSSTPGFPFVHRRLASSDPVPESQRPRDRSKPPRDIAVLGAGLTGLSTAWYLTRLLPTARITIYDEKYRVGGWIETDEVRVSTPDLGEGTVRFEHAARMVNPLTKTKLPRWDDLVFFDLVSKLGLENQLMSKTVDEDDVSAKGFIYYPDHLVRMPSVVVKPFTNPLKTFTSLVGTGKQVLTEPLFQGLLGELWKGSRRMGNQEEMLREMRVNPEADRSIGDFFADLLGGRQVVDRFLSAMTHGITGGDVWQISMRDGPFADNLIPPRTSDMPVSTRIVRRSDLELLRELGRDKATFNLAKRHVNSTGLWFRDGFATLPNAMAKALRANPHVTFKLGDRVRKLRYNDQLDKVAVTSDSSTEPVFYDKVVSTIYARQLAWITDNQLPSLEKSEAVSIMLVNIWYPVPKLNFPHIGFGYLLPQALPAEANPECVLGVIFDSDREYPLPTPSNPDPPPRGADFRQGTKLTVMMGGHYWDDLPAACIPNEEEAQQVALRAVQRHLGIPDELAEKAHTQAKLCVCCIPQVLVGHAQRMKKAHGELEWAYKGRLAVAGQSYTNPGVVNCLRAGRDVAVHIAREHFPYELEPDRRRREEERKLGKSPTIVPEQETWPVGETGLQRFGTPPVFDGAANWAFPLRYGSKALVDEEGNLIYPLKEGDPPKM